MLTVEIRSCCSLKYSGPSKLAGAEFSRWSLPICEWPQISEDYLRLGGVRAYCDARKATCFDVLDLRLLSLKGL